ncbi:MAG: LysM peptidoglycan-binding domain-containing M23 family metallopeptidase [Caldilineales bacterium]|nr:LysM peptidoglycan-binding domain-containing M23 family metallopeptidase [Caldilineales bacterium]MCW5860963.1 peptidoglycan DD-metalloendopeptidase family protein [Caldilineales bacterium]
MQKRSHSEADASNPPPEPDALANDTWDRAYRFWQKCCQEVVGQGSDRYTPIRLASHLVLLAVAVSLLMLSQVDLPKWDIAPRAFLPAPPVTPAPVTLGQLVAASGGSSVNSLGPLVRNAVPFTTIPDRPRLDVETYVVQSGDSVFAIAEKFGLKPETILWSNPLLEANPDLLRVGDRVAILPTNGVYHKIVAKDTLASIAKQYKVDVKAITDYGWNKLASADQPLLSGGYLIIPGGQKPYVPRTVTVFNGPVPAGARRGTGTFVMPAGGTLTQKYWGGHRAVDIGAWLGSPVAASDSGFVVYAGWDKTGYGNLIVVDHGNGYTSYYAHLSKIFVRVGESVARGQRIGSVGSTGHSTGPHLHFEIRYRGVQQNPFSYLH